MVNVAEAKPKPKAQRNFTDPESRIMKDGATGSFEQSYNAQIAVDGTAQIIVAATLTQAVNDKQQLLALSKTPFAAPATGNQNQDLEESIRNNSTRLSARAEK